MAEPVADDSRTLGLALGRTSDDALLRVTRMIDQLPDRGAVDSVLAPMRARLACLRPERPMTRTRLLFVPIETLLVPDSRWRAGDPTVPRSLLAPLAGLLFPDPEPRVATAELAGADEAAITRAGTPVWSAARSGLAALLAGAQPDWPVRSGLDRALVLPLLPALELLLGQAVRLRTLPLQDHAGLDRELAALLGEAREQGALCWTMMLSLLLELAPPARVGMAAIAAMPRTPGPFQAGIDRAIGLQLDRMERLAADPLPDGPADCVALAARQTLSRQLETLGAMDRVPGEPGRLTALRQAIDDGNRRLLQATLRARQDDLAGHGDAAPLDDSAVLGLEAEARQLRALSLELSRTSGQVLHERLLDQMAASYLRAPPSVGLGAVDRMRLTELLIGSDAAIRLMERNAE